MRSIDSADSARAARVRRAPTRPRLAIARCASLVVLSLAIAALSVGDAHAARCKVDRHRYQPGGFGEALVCAGTRLDDVWVRFAPDGALTGIYWSEYQGEHLKRTIQLHDNGTVAFIAENRAVKGGFHKQARGTSHFVFPRGGRMQVELDGRDGLRLRVRDAAGHEWRLSGTRLDHPGAPRVSYVVETIDGTPQKSRPIGFETAGVVGVDLVAVRTLYLARQQPSLVAMLDRRSDKYRKLKSVFHDPQGASCAVANAELFVPSTTNPSDRYEDMFKFTDDASLAAFLAKACPNLDLGVLDPAQ